MIPTVTLLVDPRGWPAPLDPEMVNSVLQARLLPQLPVDVRALTADDHWFQALPQDSALVFVLLTRPLAPGWRNVVANWLGPTHTLYAMYLDSVDPGDIRALANLTSSQLVARAPYRIVQHNAIGLENAMQWVAGILQKQFELAPALPPVRVAPARWRHLPSNREDEFYYPEEFTTSLDGVAGYRLVAASHRGKTHAHQGTFREDAVSITKTSHWNIMAVADGAGTADLARVGSNLAVSRATAAMRDAMPAAPVAEDVGRAIWAGLKAAYQAIRGFSSERSLTMSDLNTTLQLLLHWPQDKGCLLGVAHVGDGIVTAETPDGQYYLLTEPDTDPDESSRTLFLTSGPLKQWMERTKVYQFDEPLDIVALMTDGLSGDLEPYDELLHTNLFEALRSRVLCYPLPQRENALLSLISYDRRGSFDDRSLAVLSRE
jgi:serine/threonine protein phosphatase PrpC